MQLDKEVREKDILNTIKQLVSLRTVDGNKQAFKKAADFIKSFFKNSSLHISEYNFEGYPAFIITTRETNTPQFFLQGHIDVVDGSDEQFKPLEKGPFLFARGAVDMKGFDAVAMHLLRDLADMHPEIDAGIMLTFDEEIGGANGAARLAEMGFRPRILLNGDGGYNYAVIHAEKGILKVKLSVTSDANRHPYPWDGQNAFDLMVQDYSRIQQLFTKREQATDEDNWYTTCSSYDVRVENEPSFSPHSAEMKINIYFTENMTSEELFQRIKRVLKFSVIEKLTASERVYLSAHSLYVSRMQQIMEEQFHRKISIRSENGSSDARFFTGKDIPIIIVKMVGEDHHGPKERLYIPSILPMYNSLRMFIEEFAHKDKTRVKETILHD